MAVLAVELEELAGSLDRKDHVAADDLPLHRVQAELEARHDAEVAAAATHRPVQVGILFRARVAELAVRGHDVHRFHVVEREAEAPRDASEATAEREPADPGVGHRARRRHEAVRHRLVIEIPQQAAALDVCPACSRIHPDAAQPRQVDLDAAVAGGLARETMAAALHGDEQLALARKGDRVPDVRGTGRLHDERRVLVELGVQDPARRVVARIAGEQERPAQARLEFGDRHLFKDGCRAVELDRGETARGL